MNRRLQAILDEVQDGRGVIDVGTDHGYLPAALAKSGYHGNLFASDLREGPLQAARRTAEQEGVTERIQFLLCDGLSLCDPEAVDTLVIAGLGGDVICRILDRAEWTMDSRYTMILQPMTKAEVLRYWLSNNEYGIVGENLVEDNGKIYSILRVRFGSDCGRLSDAELFTGSLALVREHTLFPSFLDEQMSRIRKILSGMEAGMDGSANGRRALMRTILKQMEEMRSI